MVGTPTNTQKPSGLGHQQVSALFCLSRKTDVLLSLLDQLPLQTRI